MGTYLNPELLIEVFHDSAWRDVLADAKTFTVESGGLLEIPLCTVRLKSTSSKYTKGTYDFDRGDWLRIQANVRDAWDIMFEGRIYRRPAYIKGAKDEEVEFIAKGTIKRFDEDTITDEFNSDNVKIKDAIETALSWPDSGLAFGSLVSSGTDIETTLTPHDPPQESVLDFIRECCEEIDYAGWCDYDSYTINLHPVGSQATSPAVTLNPPYKKVDPVQHIEDLYSHIFVHGGTDKGIPNDEDHIWTDEHPSGTWTGTNVTVSDDTTDFKKGTKSVKTTITDPNLSATLTCDLKLAYGDYIDCSHLSGKGHGRFQKLYVYIKASEVLAGSFLIRLVDANGDKIKKTEIYNRGEYSDWKIIEISDLGGSFGAEEEWDYSGDSTSFDWSQVQKFEVYVTPDCTEIKIDGLWFYGGLEIDPFAYPSLNPPIKDETALLYPVVCHENLGKSIKTFEAAQSEGQRILDLMKTEYEQFTVECHKCYPWIKPSQTLTFSLPEYDISSATYVIASYTHEWKALRKRLWTTFNLVPSP